MPQAALWGSAVTLHHTMKSLENDSLQGKTLLVFEEESEKRNPHFDEHSFKNSQQKHNYSSPLSISMNHHRHTATLKTKQTPGDKLAWVPGHFSLQMKCLWPVSSDSKDNNNHNCLCSAFPACLRDADAEVLPIWISSNQPTEAGLLHNIHRDVRKRWEWEMSI